MEQQLPGFPSELLTFPTQPFLRWPEGNGTSRSRREDFQNSIDLRTVPVIRRSKTVRVDEERYRIREMNEMKESCG